MTWLQILAQGTVIATFVGVGIAVAAYFNGKHVKEGVRETKEMINEMGKMINDIGRMINDNGKMINEMGKMINEMGRMINDIGRMITEGQKETRELIEKIDNRAEERHREVLHALNLI